MYWKRAVFKFLPLQTFVSLRTWYRKILKRLKKPLSEKEFQELLVHDLQIQRGAVVFIHSSTDALNVSFPTYRILEILLETVGENGTLVFPAWHFTYRAEEYLNKHLVFDVEHSPSMLGLLSELARRHPDAKRSIHPTSSIVAIGKYANAIISGHGESIWPCDEMSPYYKVMQYKGIIVGIGVNNNFLSFVHCPEDVLKNRFPVKTRLDIIFDASVRTTDGSITVIKTLAAHPQINNQDIPAFMNKYIPKTVCKNYAIRGNRFFVASTKELFDNMIVLANKGITIYTTGAKLRND
jgi:aminoglycoside 3-N-acetyltransferase